MLYRFKSRAAAELIMLEPQGRRILAIIGKTPGAGGIVTAAQIPAAIAALQAAVAADEERPPGPELPDLPDAPDAAEAEERADSVGLRQRAAPFIELLRRSAAQDADVVWAV